MAYDPMAFRFDAGATWLNLLATRGRSYGAEPIERLADPGRLHEWLQQCELRPQQRPTEVDLLRARALREDLRQVAMATVTGNPPPAVPVAAMKKAVRAADPVRLVGRKRLRRKRPRTTAEALTRIARQGIDHLTGPERAYLRICSERDCRCVFADPTGRRRYCPAPACASRGRVRAMRERRREPTGT